MTLNLSVVPIADWWPLGPVLLILLVLTLPAVRRRAARPFERRVLRTTAVLHTLLQAAGIVNAHFEFCRTLGQAFGDPPADVVGLTEARAEEGTVPDTGRIVSVDVPATASAFTARPRQVSLPPAWFAKDRRRLPVVMLLHGEPGSPQDWIDGGQAQASAEESPSGTTGSHRWW